MTLRRPAIAATIVAALLLAGCTATPPAPTPTAATPTPTAPCLVGTWEAGRDALQPVYDAIPAELDYPAATLAPEASVTVSFAADGTFSLTQDVPVTLEWEGHPAAVALGGTMAGGYAASGTALTLTATADKLTVAPADDRPASALFAAATQETLTEWPVAASSFQCDGDALTLQLETEGHVAPVEFARR